MWFHYITVISQTVKYRMGSLRLLLYFSMGQLWKRIKFAQVLLIENRPQIVVLPLRAAN